MDISFLKNNISSYLLLSNRDKEQVIMKVLGDNLRNYELIYDQKNNIIVFDKKNKLEFVYVPGGNYTKGLSKQEQEEAEKISEVVNMNYDEMRPLVQCEVSSILVSRIPVTYASIKNNGDYHPIFLKYEDAERYALSKHCRLPNETEWEYFARAGTNSLFPFGDRLPDEEQLVKWLDMDFKEPEKLNANKLGIYGLFIGEWMQDYYTENYTTVEHMDDRVVRGGGSIFWPWQDQEWVWCASAMRMPSNGLLDGTCGFRLVREIYSE